MAGEDRNTAAYLKQHLLKNGSAYSFFQVIRVLRRIDEEARTDLAVSELARTVRIRPNLSLAFPAADVEGVKEIQDGQSSRFQVVTNFLGLYGTSSPLPTFYTEELMDEAADDESVARDFIDTLNHRLYLLFFESLQKYRPFYHIVEDDRGHYQNHLFCLEGLGEESHRRGLPDASQLLRYIGLFSQRPRSAEGLRTILQDALGYEVDIVACLLRKARIPEDQLLCLGLSGGVLGNDCVLGRELDDRMGKFRIVVGPLSAEQYRSFFPGSESYQRLVLLTDLYLQDPLEYEVEVSMHEQQAQTTCLGAPSWSRLGMDTWLYAGGEIGRTKSTFYPSAHGEQGLTGA
ncbi:MAG: type VI secretion system baseplate subunit TssG [Desulfofustis sp.]|jgi:type VI secretion system protein ImpH|nr:type VI secretion system baseplate subunit TssG [Desulfofustis sp.]